MSAERPHHERGYSKLDKLNACLDFTGKPVGAAANRGTDVHAKVEGHITGKAPSRDPYIISAASRIRAHAGEILSVEEKLSLLVGFREASYGYADYVGKNGDDLVVVDLKTGSQPASSYRLQMMALALAAMDHYGHDKAKAVLVYADSEDDYVYEFDKELAENEIFQLFARLDVRNEPRQKNDYCGWCALRQSCPVWIEPASEVKELAPHAQGLLLTKEDALSRPQVYLAALEALEAIILEDWDLKGVIKSRLEAGEAVEGYKLQPRKGTTSVASVEDVIIKVVKAVGAAKAAEFIKVDASKMTKAWSAFSSDPLPVDLVEAPGTTALVKAKGGAK